MLLRQIIEELKTQSQYLYDILKRVEELEKAVNEGRVEARSTVEKVQVRD